MKTHSNKNIATPTFHSHLLHDRPLNAAARKTTALPAGLEDGDGWLEPLAQIALILCLVGAFLACGLRVATPADGTRQPSLNAGSPAVTEVASLPGAKPAAPRAL